MKRLFNNIMLLAGVLAAVATLAIVGASCRMQQRPKPLVVVSIAPQQFLLEQIAGDRVDVVSLIATQSNPENYEPKTSDMMKLETAQAYFTIGNIGYEAAIVSKVKSNNPQLRIFNNSQGINFLAGQDADDGDCDPHVWTSVKNAKVIARNMLSGLVTLYPKQKKYFTRRYNVLCDSLDSLDAQLTRQLAPVRGSTFVIWHPTLSYFARDYGLKQLALDNGKEPTAADVKRRVELARNSGARVILVQRQFDGRAASAINKMIGCTTVEINPMSGDWPGEMRHIASALTAAK